MTLDELKATMKQNLADLRKGAVNLTKGQYLRHVLKLWNRYPDSKDPEKTAAFNRIAREAFKESRREHSSTVAFPTPKKEAAQ